MIYVLLQVDTFRTGRFAPDFKSADYEMDISGRASADDLTSLDRAHMVL